MNINKIYKKKYKNIIYANSYTNKCQRKRETN